MRLTGILSERKRNRFLKRVTKKLKWVFMPSRETTPIFVFGKQRSGTTMFMDIMENRPDTEVFQEWEPSVFNAECRIRDFNAVDRAIKHSRAAFACFKPICDSHIIRDFVTHYPDGKIIWVFRGYLDNANSAIRRFSESDRAIRLICEGKPGGGWLQEGLTMNAAETLQSLYEQSLSKFEMSCLTWWARNRLLIENGITNHPNVYLLKYENLVQDPELTFRKLESALGLPLIKASYSNVHARSIAKHDFPVISPAISSICDDLSHKLDLIIKDQDARIGFK